MSIDGVTGVCGSSSGCVAVAVAVAGWQWLAWQGGSGSG
jgi:hypothetical protein